MDELVLLASTHHCAYSYNLSTWSSPRSLITISNLGDGFTLRCFQSLSVPYIATLRCPWQDSRHTRGTFILVLSSLISNQLLLADVPLSLGAQTISSSIFTLKLGCWRITGISCRFQRNDSSICKSVHL